MTLRELPRRFAATREAFHQVAFFAIAPARYKSVGRMGLKDTPGGFGTPEFAGQIARVEGDLLIHENDGNIASQTISTIRAAAEFFGNEYEEQWFADFHDPLAPSEPNAPLSVSAAASSALGDWFEFGFRVLNEVRAHGVEGDDVSEVQLWPEHFDPATELGDYEKGQRASFGASPGDGAHPEPYLYVASWSEIDRANEYWNDESFNGAGLSYADLLAADDPVGKAVDFYLQGYKILHSD